MADLPDWYQSDGKTATTPTPAPQPAAQAPIDVASLPTPAQNSPLPDWYSDGKTELKASIAAGAKTPPEQAAKIIRLQAQTGLPADMVSRNVEQLSQQTAADSVDHGSLLKYAPKVAEWLAENPLNSAISLPDMKTLQYQENLIKNIGANVGKGFRDIELSALGVQAAMGTLTPQQRQRQAEIEKLNESVPNYGITGPIESLPGKMAQGAPLMGASFVASLAGAAAGAAASIPEGGLGAIPGLAAGAIPFAVSEFGSSYLDYEKIRDKDGQPLDPSVIRGAAAVSGVLNGAMMMVPQKMLLSKIPGVSSLTRSGLKEILQSPTARTAMTSYLKGIGEQASVQGGMNFMQSMVRSAGADISRMVSDGSIHTMTPAAILSNIFGADKLKQATASIPAGVEMGAAFGGSFGAVGLMHEMTKVQEAKANVSAFDNLGKSVASMQMMEHSPQKTAEVIQRLAQDGPVSHVYAPMDSFNKYWTDKGQDPRAVATAIFGSPDHYDEASRTGADLQIPIENYATTIAPTEHNTFFQNELRSSPTAMNGREVEEYLKDKMKETDQQAASPDQEARDKIGLSIVPDEQQPPPTEPAAQETAPATPVDPAAAHVAAAHELQGIKPLFADPAAFGMSEVEAAKYRRAHEEAGAMAQDNLTRKIIDRTLREKSHKWNDEREDIRQDVEKESWQHKDFRAKEILTKPIHTKERAAELLAQYRESYHFQREQFDLWKSLIKTGIKPSAETEEYKQLPTWMKKSDGRGIDEVTDEARAQGLLGEHEDIYQKLRSVKAPEKPGKLEDYVPRVIQELEPVKLDREATKRDFPDVNLTKLRGMFSEKGGLHPDAIAGMLGFDSGSELLHSLQTTPDRKEWIKETTDNKMQELHPDPTSNANLPLAAMRAVHNEKRSQLLRQELQYLASDHLATLKGLIRRVTRPIPRIEDVRNQAEELIANKVNREIVPTMYQRAEAHASREAVEHLTRGDLEKAFESKQRELLNHELYRAASAAKEDIQKRIDRASELTKEKVRAKIGKAGGAYLEQLDSILDRFDFQKNVSGKDLDRRDSLRDFITDRMSEGYEPAIPEKLLNDAYRQHYKDMTYNDFKDVTNTMDTIRNLAKLKNELLANAKQRDYETAKAEIINSILENHDVKTEIPTPRRTKESGFAKPYLASMTRMEFLFDRLNGYKPLGAAFDYFFKPTVDAQNAESSMMHEKMYKLENGLALNDIFSAYSKSERAKWYFDKTYIPEIKTALLKPNILMAALNWGNEYNRNALKEGYKWEDSHVQAIFKHLDSRDWATVQKIWDHLETYRPDIGKLEKKLNGLEPEWVTPSPFTVKSSDGKTINLTGGYFPILFDSKLSWRQSQLNEKSEAADLFGGQWSKAMTKDGHTVTRTNTGGKPLLLQFSALTEHLSNVIHDLTHRETIIDLNKLISDPDIRQNIIGAVGEDQYRLLTPWLRHIAGEKFGEPANPIEGLLGAVRGMATTTKLGLGVVSALKHLTNYGMAVNEIGVGYAAKGFKDTLGNPLKLSETWKAVTAKSQMMADFDENYDRDVRDMFKGMNITGSREGMSFLPESVNAGLSVTDSYTHGLRQAFFTHYGYMYKSVALPAWVGAFQKAMDGKIENAKAGDEKAAVDYADHVVRTTIASASVKDLPNIMNQKGLMKLFTMYYGPMNLVFNQLQKATHQFSASSIPKLVGTATFMWFGPALIQQVLSGRQPNADDDAETKVKSFANAVASYPLEGMVGLRDAVRAIESGGRDFSMSPVEDSIAGIIKSGIALKQHSTGEKDEMTQSDLNNFANTAGYFSGMPTTQIMKSVEYAYDWMTGDAQPESPIEGVWRTLIGKKRE